MEKSNIVNLEDYSKEREIKAFLNVLKLGKVIEVVNIDENGIVDLYEFAIHRLGFAFGYDFVTFEEKPKVYQIDLEMNDTFYDDDKPGIYITQLYDIDLKDEKYYSLIEKKIDLARKIERWYFDNFLKNVEIEYSNDSRQLHKEDDKYFKNKECEIIDFAKASRNIQKKKVLDLVHKKR